MCEGVTYSGEGDAGGCGAAVVAVADYDEGKGDCLVGPWVHWARGYRWDVDCIADSTAVATTVDSEGLRRQRHCSVFVMCTDYLVRYAVGVQIAIAN